jgi:Fur family ferric uptake transcriptional regulator
MRASSVNQFILKTLSQNQAHLTANQVYENLREQLPAVNPSTVYRALEKLAHEGLISVSDMGQSAVVYEAVDGERHHHLVCQYCGLVCTIGDEAVSDFFKQLEPENDFKIATNHLILFGYCSKCRKNHWS